MAVSRSRGFFCTCIFAPIADFDADYRFADLVVALTREKLVLAAYPYVGEHGYNLSGGE